MQPYMKWDNESLSIPCQSPILRNGDLKAMAAVNWVYHRLGIAAKEKSTYSVFMVAFRQKEPSVLGNRLLLVSERVISDSHCVAHERSNGADLSGLEPVLIDGSHFGDGLYYLK
jgi:hypothetical protein